MAVNITHYKLIPKAKFQLLEFPLDSSAEAGDIASTRRGALYDGLALVVSL